MNWVITKDKTGNQVGTGTFKGDPKTLPFEFKIFDDDGELYYEGRSDDADSQAAFDPLDWATAHAGASYIQYKRGNTWVTL